MTAKTGGKKRKSKAETKAERERKLEEVARKAEEERIVREQKAKVAKDLTSQLMCRIVYFLC